MYTNISIKFNSFKFGNTRKSFDYNHPDVVSRKRKRTSKETNQDTEPEAGNFTWGMENYLPNPPQSEDASVNRVVEEGIQEDICKCQRYYG